MQNENSNQFQQQLEKEGFAKSFGGEYVGSPLQIGTYKKLESADNAYKQFIRQTYGSYENYLRMNRIDEAVSVYDPTRDYIMDVTVITENASYKSDHISTQEVIMEALSGVCTIVFMKNDGSVGRITGTLEKNMIPPSKNQTRTSLFFPQKNDRVILWDLNKQDWRSFYMDRVIKFVRDDTISVE
jgi:hypothetical protein